MLGQFIVANRSELVARCTHLVSATPLPLGLAAEDAAQGVAQFVDQLARTLGAHSSTSPSSGCSVASMRPRPLGRSTAAQVVHHYGGLCESITDLAMERGATISTTDFLTLNRFLNGTLAAAVVTCRQGHDQDSVDIAAAKSNQDAGYFAHELRNLLNTALLSFEVLKIRQAGVADTTGRVLQNSLLGLRDLVADSLNSVSLARRAAVRTSFLLAPFIDEIGAGAALLARATGIRLTVLPVDDGIAIAGDRRALAGAVTNLLQNAFKFTRPQTRVSLRASAKAGRVRIEVEDECGGISGNAEDLFNPFEQHGTDRSGLGLGLSHSRQGVEASHGHIHARSLPGQGCVFTIDLPIAPAPAHAGAIISPRARGVVQQQAMSAGLVAAALQPALVA